MELTAKQKIANAAFRLFLEKGYQNTTIREIAQECGFSHVNVLRHYNSKGELAISLVENYIRNLIQTTSEQAEGIGLLPSQRMSDLYWLSHYHFMTNHPEFARFYCSVYESMRSEFYDLLTGLSGLLHVTTGLFGLPMTLEDAEAELFSKLITDADLHMVQMLSEKHIEPVWAVRGISKLLQMLLLQRSDEQIQDTAAESRELLRQDIACCVESLEAALLHKN